MSEEIKKEIKPVKLTKIAIRNEIKALDLELERCTNKMWDKNITNEEAEKLKVLCNILLDKRLVLMKVRDEKKINEKASNTTNQK